MHSSCTHPRLRSRSPHSNLQVRWRTDLSLCVCVRLSANGLDITFSQDLQVSALANGHLAKSVRAIALADLAASSTGDGGGHITVKGNVGLNASATGHGNETHAANFVDASAVFLAHGASTAFTGIRFVGGGSNVEPAVEISLGGGLDIHAFASGNQASLVIASALAQLVAGGQGNAHVGDILVDGPVDVVASANGLDIGTADHSRNGAHIGSVLAIAQLEARGTVDDHAHDIDFNGAVTIAANAHGSHVGTFASDTGDGNLGNVAGKVGAYAHLGVADAASATFGGDPTVNALASGHHVGSVSVGGSNEHVAAGSNEVLGSVIASANIHSTDVGKLTFDDDAKVTANAIGHDIGVVSIDGANAHIATDGGEVQGRVTANASIDIDGGDVTAHRNVTVTADAAGTDVGVVSVDGNGARIATASGAGSQNASIFGIVEANAVLDIEHASANVAGILTVAASANGSHVGTMQATGNGDIIAEALSRNTGYVTGRIGGAVLADASIDAFSAGVLAFDQVTVTAEGGGRNVGVVDVTGNSAAIAEALDRGSYRNSSIGGASAAVSGDVAARAVIQLSDVDDVTFGGGVSVTANAGGSDVGAIAVTGQDAAVGLARSMRIDDTNGLALARVAGQVGAQASIDAVGVDSLDFDGAVQVDADANGKHVGSVDVIGSNAHVAIAGVATDDSIQRDANAVVEGSVHDFAGIMLGNFGAPGGVVRRATFEGNVGITASASGLAVGIVSVHGNGAHIASAAGNFGDEASIIGSVSVFAGLVMQDGTLDRNAQAQSVAFERNLSIAGEAEGNHVGSAGAVGTSARIGVAAGSLNGVDIEGKVDARAVLFAFGGSSVKAVTFNAVSVTANAQGAHVAAAAATGDGGIVDVGDGHSLSFLNGVVGADMRIVQQRSEALGGECAVADAVQRCVGHQTSVRGWRDRDTPNPSPT